MRRGPRASQALDESVCGNHLSHSHSATRSSAASAATTRSAGEWNAAAEQTMARVSDRASSEGPPISIRSIARRSAAAGRSGCRVCTASSRRSADAATGSAPSIVAGSGGTSARDSGWLHTAYRTCRNCDSATVRSQSRAIISA